MCNTFFLPFFRLFWEYGVVIQYWWENISFMYLNLWCNSVLKRLGKFHKVRGLNYEWIYFRKLSKWMTFFVIYLVENEHDGSLNRNSASMTCVASSNSTSLGRDGDINGVVGSDQVLFINIQFQAFVGWWIVYHWGQILLEPYSGFLKNFQLTVAVC